MERISNIYEVTQRLCGMVKPCGDSTIDEVRLENLKDTNQVVEHLIDDIISVAHNRIAPEHSVRLAGSTAKKFLDDIREAIDNQLGPRIV